MEIMDNFNCNLRFKFNFNINFKNHFVKDYLFTKQN